MRRHACDEGAAGQFVDWCRTPLGEALRVRETQQLDDSLSNLFGYHLLWVDPLWPLDGLSGSRVRHQVVMDGGRHAGGATLRGRADAIPVQTDTLDVIVLPHILEFSDDPHQVLREVDRCLIPEGHVVVLGFNPWSSWGMRRLLSGWQGRVPWCGRFIGAGRLGDWFSLLGFDTVEVSPVIVEPPVNRSGIIERMGWTARLAERGWPFPASAYVYVARKRVIGMTPIRPRWRPRRGLLSPGIIEPTRRDGEL